MTLNALIDLFKKINSFYEKENLLLREGSITPLLEKTSEKEALQKSMAEALETFEQSTAHRTLEPEAKNLLNTYLQSMQRLSQENHKLIQSFHGRYEGFFHRLCQVIQDSEQKKHTRYSPSGRFHMSANGKQMVSQHFISSTL
jgi:hypothetical protein